MTSPHFLTRSMQFVFPFALAFTVSLPPLRAEWNQWRGAERDGAAKDVPLREGMPETGLKPLWINREDVGSGGGWSSPIVADGRVFQYSHEQNRREGVNPPPEKYPPLTDEQKKTLSPEEQKSYEEKRAEEDRERRKKLLRFTDRIACLDAATGKRIWLHERESESTRWRQSSTPVVSQGRLYYVGADRQAVCLNAEDGSKRWAVAIPVEAKLEGGQVDPISSSPLVTNGKVIVLAEQLIALDAEDGSLLWTGKTKQDGAIYSSPAVWHSPSGDRIIANLGNLGTICVDAANGRELWRVESDAGRSSPVVEGNTLLTYGGSRKGGLRRYEMTDEGAELKWTSHRFADQGSSPVVANGRVFVQSSRDLACVNLEDGKTIWQGPLDGDNPRYTSPIVVGEQVLYTFASVLCAAANEDEFTPKFQGHISDEGLLASEDHFRQLLKIDSLSDAEAEKVWQRQVVSQGPRQCVSPAVADGRLYIRLNGGLVCYDLRANPSE